MNEKLSEFETFIHKHGYHFLDKIFTQSRTKSLKQLVHSIVEKK